MADYQMGGGYYEGETEEEYLARKRREAQEQAQAQAQDQESGGITAQRPGGFMDAVGQYATNRFNAAQQRVADVGQMVTDPGAAMQRRMGLAVTQDAANTEVQSQQVKTYADGSQEEIIKKQLPPSGAVSDAEQQLNQQAPPTAPVAPQPQLPPTGAVSTAEQQLNPQATEAAVARMRAAMAATQPPPEAAPAGPSIPQGLVAGGGVPAVPNIGQGQLPQGGAPTQVASTSVNPAQQPYTGQGIRMPAPGGVPSLAATGTEFMTDQQKQVFYDQKYRESQPPEDRARQAVIDAHNEKDPGKRQTALANILVNGDAASKQLAQNFLTEDFSKQKSIREAEKKIEEATPTELARYMKERNKEGSYVKAILFARLGLTDLAQREQELLNPALKMDTAVVGKDKYTVVRDSQGAITKAFDVNGQEVRQRDLARISAAAMPTKAFLLPQSGGGLMQKTIVGPDGKEQVITGQVFTDPQTQETYFQAGSTRYDTSGLTTPAQNVVSAYNVAGAKQQGEQSAKTGSGQGTLVPINTATGTKVEESKQVSAASVADGLGLSQKIISGTRATAEQQAMYDESVAAGRPGKTAQGNPIAKPGTSAHESANAIDYPTSRATAEDLRKLREAGFVQTLPKTDPNHWERTGTGGVTTTVATGGGQRPGENYLDYEARLKRESASAEKAAAANIDLSKEERSNFLTYDEKDIIPKADAGSNISKIRKQQLKGPDGILNNPDIVGIMSGGGTQAQEFANLIRDTVTGGIKDDELSRRVNLLGISDPVKRARIYNQLALNNTLAPETLKANSGAGSVSDAEQTANRRNNIDITKVPLYTAVTMLGRDQFEKDLSVSRQAFRNANPGLTTVRSFSDAWGKEKERLQGEYDRIYEARAKYIAKHSPDGSNPYAITEAYKQFPVPEFSRDGGWNYGTEYARKAARKPLDSFNK